MDVSEKYVKMCEKAQEIQGLREELDVGDYIFDLMDIDGVYVFSLGNGRDYNTKGDSEFWIPRQDQLQEMIEIEEYQLELYTKGNILAQICSCWGLDNEYMPNFDTMEQLWLAEIMKEKYSKFWNQETENWISPAGELPNNYL